MELVLLQSGELTETHVDDSLSLNVGKAESLGECSLGFVGALGAAYD